MFKDQFVIKLPVKSIAKSKEFYTQLKLFTLSGNENLLGIFIEENKIYLYDELFFKESFPNIPINTNQIKDVVIEVDLDNKEELFELALNVKKAGGMIIKEPYGNDTESLSFRFFTFLDLDGYYWSVSYFSA